MSQTSTYSDPFGVDSKEIYKKPSFVTSNPGKTSKAAAVLKANPNRIQAVPTPNVAAKAQSLNTRNQRTRKKPLAPGCAECETTSALFTSDV